MKRNMKTNNRSMARSRKSEIREPIAKLTTKERKEHKEGKVKKSSQPADNLSVCRTKNNKVRRLVEKEWMRMAIAKVAAEEWWAKSPPGRRVLAMRIARMIGELTESKRIEIRSEAGAVRVRFIHLLQRPEPGCLSAIMLPELPPGGWN